jgi:hypothetical protein
MNRKAIRDLASKELIKTADRYATTARIATRSRSRGNALRSSH